MTWQVQIFTRDGAFVRKFGATVLQHPRGVTVDFRGRIVVVECKVSLTHVLCSPANSMMYSAALAQGCPQGRFSHIFVSSA